MSDLKIAEVAEELSCSPRLVWRLIAEGSLQSYMIGRRARRVTRQSLDAFKKAQAVVPERRARA